jgi:hypothetical protein
MVRFIKLLLLCSLYISMLSAISIVKATPSVAQDKVNDRETEGLIGPVRRIETYISKILYQNGNPVEQPGILVESATYDLIGKKIDSEYHPNPYASPLTGKESYKHDTNGNIIEMTLLGPRGAILRKELYTYQFDYAGNWVKMFTSVVINESGRVSLKLTEVTNRTISYYMNEKLLTELNNAGTTTAKQPTTTSDVVASLTSGPINNSSSTRNRQFPTIGPIYSPSPLVPSIFNEPFSYPTVANNAITLELDSLPAPPQANVVKKTQSNLTAKELVQNKTDDVIAGIAGGLNTTDDNVGVAKPKASPLLNPISGGVLNGKAIKLPLPIYPEKAKTIRIKNPEMLKVSVQVVIDETGKVISAKALTGHILLRDSAIEAALDATFTPTLLSNQPVKVIGVINYLFSAQ